MFIRDEDMFVFEFDRKYYWSALKQLGPDCDWDSFFVFILGA